jgi:plastocyanin
LAVPASAADHSVVATSGSTFQPDELTVALGDTITWTNPSGGFHNVKFDDGSFEMPAEPGSSWPTVQKTFDAPGVYSYHCELHGAPNRQGMSGTVTVLDENGNPPAPTFEGPGLKVAGPFEQKLSKVLKNGVRAKFTCENGCDYEIDITLTPKVAKRLGFAEKTVTVGKAKGSSAAGKVEVKDVALSKSAKKKFKKAERKFKVFLTIVGEKDVSASSGYVVKIKP